MACGEKGKLFSIDDPDDPRIAEYLSVRDRDLAGRGDRFIAEGDVVVRALLSPSSRFQAESILVSHSRLAALEPLLALAGTVPVYVAGRALMDRIVGFPIHRGLLAVGRRGGSGPDSEALAGLASARLVLGLIGLANHDNVGGLFRNAAAFGVDAVLLDRATCDPLYRKALRVSVGASLLVPFACLATGEDVVRRLAEHGFATFGLSPGGREPIGQVRWPERTALLLGREGDGLPPALLERTRSVHIPMAPGFDSLNVATAAGIALQAAFSGRQASRDGSLPD